MPRTINFNENDNDENNLQRNGFDWCMMPLIFLVSINITSAIIACECEACQKNVLLANDIKLN